MSDGADRLRELAYKIDTPIDYVTPAGHFAFHNRFQIRDHFIGIDEDRFEVSPTDGSEKVLLTSGTMGEKIKDSRYGILTGRGYSAFNDALTAGKKWRQIIISTLARMGVSCDMGDDLDDYIRPHQITDLAKGMFGFTPLDVVFQDRIGLLVVDTQPPPTFFFATVDGVVQSRPGPSTDEVSSALSRYSGDWSDELRLAYTLVHSALADSNVETRYILFVTVIEALIPYRRRDDSLSALLEALKPDADGHVEFDEDTRESVKKLLDTSQYNSIRQYGLRLAARLSGEYGGKAPKKYFDEIYGTRSALAHGNLRDVPHLSEQALATQLGELRRFVLDILETWTANPTFEVASSTDDGTAEPSPEQG